MAETGTDLSACPISLTGHTVPPERLKLIVEHVASLAKTALKVSDDLPLQADVSDFVRVLEKNGG